METRLKGWKSAGNSNIESELGPETVRQLIEGIQRLLAPHGVKAEAVSNAFNETLLDIDDNNIRSNIEELRSFMLGTIVWKIFAPGSAPWINSQTKSGNAVPLDLMMAAYSIWRHAVHLAAEQGVDDAAAAEALVQVTHATADRIIGAGRNKKIGEVRDVRNYMFTAFMHLIPRIAAKQGSSRTDHVRLGMWEISDEGTFLEALESGVLCRELLNAMPPRGKSVAIARYILSYSWEETAESLDTSINAAQKALSSGIRNAFGLCMREARKMGYHRIAEFEEHLRKKNKKTRLRRKSREGHGRR